MKKAYKNQLSHSLRNHELGFDNFFYEEFDNGDAVVIYKPYGGKFKYFFDQNEGSFDAFNSAAIEYSPKNSMMPRYSNLTEFDKVLSDFLTWLEQDVSKFIEDESEVDLWEEYKKNSAAFDLSNIDYQDQSKFNRQEKEQILLGIQELRLLMLRDFSNSEIESEIINERLNYLVEATNRIENKTDWKGIFINTFITICIALSLDTQRGNELYQLFLNALHVIRFLP